MNFLEEEMPPNTNLFRNHLCMMFFSYLVELFNKLNCLYLQLRGTDRHIVDTSDQSKRFCKNENVCPSKCQQKIFANVNKIVKTDTAKNI